MLLFFFVLSTVPVLRVGEASLHNFENLAVDPLVQSLGVTKLLALRFEMSHLGSEFRLEHEVGLQFLVHLARFEIHNVQVLAFVAFLVWVYIDTDVI